MKGWRWNKRVDGCSSALCFIKQIPLFLSMLLVCHWQDLHLLSQLTSFKILWHLLHFWKNSFVKSEICVIRQSFSAMQFCCSDPHLLTCKITLIWLLYQNLISQKDAEGKDLEVKFYLTIRQREKLQSTLTMLVLH